MLLLRDAHCFRFVTHDSVEEKIQEVQRRKKELAQSVLGYLNEDERDFLLGGMVPVQCVQ